MPLGRPTLLTSDVEDTIVDAIGRGAYDWVAAEAAGIARRTFYVWLERGNKHHEARRLPKRELPYVQLLRRVRQARAQARLSAEISVKIDHPLAWLRSGPGRERPGEPGWTQSVKHELAGPAGGPVQVDLTDDSLGEVLRVLVESGVLAPGAAQAPPAAPDELRPASADAQAGGVPLAAAP